MGLALDEDLNLLLTDVPLVLERLPATLQLLDRHWSRKHELHVTMVNGPSAVVQLQRLTGEQTGDCARALADALCDHDGSDYARVTKLGEFRHATLGDDETVVEMCAVTGLEALYRDLDVRLGAQLMRPPTHITLYVRGHPIGIATDADLRSYTHSLPSLEAGRLRTLVRLTGI
jgi:hypothetical protein